MVVVIVVVAKVEVEAGVVEAPPLLLRLQLPVLPLLLQPEPVIVAGGFQGHAWEGGD